MANDNRDYHLRGIATTGVTLVADSLKTNTHLYSTYPRIDGSAADQIDFKVGATVVASLSDSEFALGSGVRDASRRGRVVIFDDFLYQGSYTEADKPWILNSGTDAQALDPDPVAAEGGVMVLTSGDDGGGVAADGSQIVCAIPVQADSGGLVFEARLHINTAVTTVQVNVGLTDSTSLELPVSIGGSDALTTTASDFAGFVYDTGADTDEWFAVAVDSDTDDTDSATTGVAPVADTYQTFRIEVSSDGATILFYLNGTLTNTLDTVGVSPDVNLYATVIVNSTTTTSRTVDIDYIEVSHNR